MFTIIEKNVDESYYHKHIFDTQFSSVNCGIQFIYSSKLYMKTTNFDFVSAIFDAISVVNNDLYSIL